MTAKKSLDLIDGDFIPISRREILSAHTLPMDVYLRINDNRLVLVGRKGTQAIEKIKIIEKDVNSRLFIKRDDFRDCVENNLTVAGVIIGRDEVSDPAKMEFLSRTVDNVFKEIETLGFNLEAMRHAKQIIKNIEKLVSQKPDLLNVITMMNNIPNELLRHSTAVCAISIMIAKGKSWTLPQTVEKLALGALLHDVGMKEIPFSIQVMPRHELNFEQRQIYETHTYRGVEILKTMPSVPVEVVQMALEHHENAFGQGYPRRIKDYRISPMAKIVGLADGFTELTIANPSQPTAKTVPEAIDYIENVMGQPYSPSAMRGLKLALERWTPHDHLKIVDPND